MEFSDNGGINVYAKIGSIDGKNGIFVNNLYNLDGTPFQMFTIDSEKDVITINGKDYKLIPYSETI